jgi:menaquinone-dependent protoporphyrinogen IX oxidase
MITEKDANALVELLYPYFIKKYKEDNSFKQTARIVNGIVTSLKEGIQVKINPYDKNTIIVQNPNNIEEISIGTSVMIMYYDSLKNAIIIAKNI